MQLLTSVFILILTVSVNAQVKLDFLMAIVSIHGKANSYLSVFLLAFKLLILNFEKLHNYINYNKEGGKQLLQRPDIVSKAQG